MRIKKVDIVGKHKWSKTHMKDVYDAAIYCIVCGELKGSSDERTR